MRMRAPIFAGLFVALSFVAAPANAANQISGTAELIPTPNADCPVVPSYPDYSALVMSGSLQGCWYTKILTAKQTPSGVYLESGEELFVGSLNGGSAGTFTTTYKFEAKFTLPLPNLDALEIKGRCQHKIVSGTGGFAGASGRVDFKDIIEKETLDLIQYDYRGHISLA